MNAPTVFSKCYVDLSVIQSPVRIDRDTYKGLLPCGMPVKVSREIHGWKVELSVAVNGITLHTACPNALEQEQWNQLEERAYRHSSSTVEKERSSAVLIAKSSGLFPS